ncbi:acyl-CoA dehydrogenase family protein [Rhodospirillales bacterium]|jgi:alkylation response protein AidB-like acyl-CoA dehydrogenase|nr:acyl-CoA dehydrogenase family protein [Rhodospirillales bacterium]
MDFTLNEDQQALQETVRKFAVSELPEIALEIEKTAAPASHDLIKRYAEMGFLGVNLPSELGGLGLSHLDAVLVLEEVAKISPAVAFPIFESCFGPTLAIAHFAPDELKQRIVPKVCAGEMIVAVSMSEPDAGTALTDLTTKVETNGDTVVVNGTKRWCSGAGHADAYVVYCRMSDEPGAKGIGAVLVEKDRAGLSFGKPEYHMGFRGIPSADIYLDKVEVSVENIVVPAGGFRQLMEAFDLERCGNTTMSLAIAQSALDYVLDYVQDRKQFGKAVVDFQAVQLQIAEMKMQVDASRLLLYRAVVNASQGLPSVADSSIAKCFANEMVRDVTGKALQLMGGYGYSTEYPIEQKMRDGWGWGIAGGTIDIQKINIAAAMVGRRFQQR